MESACKQLLLNSWLRSCLLKISLVCWASLDVSLQSARQHHWLSSSSTISPAASIMTSHNHQDLPVWLPALPTRPRFPVLQTNHQMFTRSRKLPVAVIQVLGRFNVSGLNNFPGCTIVNPRIVHFVGIACERQTQISWNHRNETKRSFRVVTETGRMPLQRSETRS